ncbi:MAG TPA: hypothetical protein VN772_02165 [Solirubrobacteraceae bacterium]|nr:hypothetical protein [Solirubrobacteraceae bacterium]
MAVTRQTPPAHARPRPALRRAGRLTGGGTTGNEQLTAATGAVLIALLAVIGVTLLRLRPLLSVHLFVGMLLIPPVALKLATTGYRFTRYYTGNPAYRRKGPPAAALRALAPMVILTTLVVFASGVALLFAGPSSRSTLLPIHKVSFVAWLIFTGLHVLGHLAEMPRALRADYGRPAQLGEDLPGRSGRALALAGALVAGVVVAVLVIGEFGPWLHYATLFHGGH